MLTPLAVDASHPFPHLLNRSHNLLVRAKLQRGGEPLHAIVQVPRAVSRLIALPRGKSADEPWEYIYLASLIKQHIGELFPGLILDEVHAFRVTRNSDLYIDEEEAENLLRSIEQELRRSSRGKAVRLEVEADCPKDVLELLLRFFDLTEADAYKLDGPLSMTHLMPLVTNDAFAKLKGPAISAGARSGASTARRFFRGLATPGRAASSSLRQLRSNCRIDRGRCA